jgi:subtilisin family serine protease
MEDPEDSGFGLVGVAPEASIYMYHVFNCYEYTTTDIILRGLLKAAEDGVDIISMSLGQTSFVSSQDPFALTTSGLDAERILHNWDRSGGYEKYKMTFGDLNATTV